MTQPDTLHTRLRAELDRRLAVARALANFGAEWIAAFYSEMDEWRIRTKLDREVIAEVAPFSAPAEDAANYIALHDPADAVRRYEGELQVLERHVAETFAGSNLPELLDLDPDQPWCRTCRGNSWPCADLVSLAHRLGVNVDG